MNLLAIDSAASVLSVAAAAGENICCFQTEAGVKHSEIVMDCIDAQMKKAGLEPQSLNGILCMGGPGSFTGLRIGFSVAKGLALALGIPFAYFPTLDCMAMPHSGFSGLVIPVIAASKNAFFCAPYRGGIRCGPDTETTAGQIAAVIAGHKNSETEKMLLSGGGVEALYAILPREMKDDLELYTENRGYARELLSLAEKTKVFDRDNTSCLFEGPEYIRKTDAEMNL